MARDVTQTLEKKYDLERAIFEAISEFEQATGAAVASIELRRSSVQPDSGAPHLQSVGLWVAV